MSTDPITPGSMPAQQSLSSIQRNVMHARREGFNDGRMQGRSEMLDWLQKKYLGDDVDRQSVEAKAILTIAKEAAEHIRSLPHKEN